MKRRRGFGLFWQTRGQAGYTITEVMIVLAVTTALFAAVAIGFNGRQARAEFTQGVRDFEAKLQTTIGEVMNGTYEPSECRAIGASGQPSVAAGAGMDTGTCIFVGKLFSNYDTPVSNSTVTTIVGRRTAGNPSRPVASMVEAAPILAPNAEQYTHTFQLQVTRMYSLATTPSTRIYALGLVVPFGGASLAESSKQVSLFGSTNSAVNVNNSSTFVQLSRGALICLRGQNGQRAEIRIGTSSTRTQVFSELDTPNTGDCSA